MSSAGLRVALAAAEASGDTLGAGLVEAVRELEPASTFAGVAGPKMIAAGCEPWNRVEEISVMGLAEVLPHLPRLLRLRRNLVRRIAQARPDVFVGIDSPDFNLAIAKQLKRAAIPTVQYVSPQIWAWRQSRVKSIRASVDLVLCVLPFETKFYEQHGVAAKFIGHPLADAIPLVADRRTAREALGLPQDRPLLALLPGSRRSEVSSLAAPFLSTAAWLQGARPGLEVAVALASEGVGEVFREAARGVAVAKPPHTIVGRAREVLAAADLVLTASGTASLEALLFKRPMVVAHRIAPLTYWIVRRLGVAKLPYFSLPNLLAGRGVVQEFVQDQVRPEVLGPALLPLLDGEELGRGWYDAFTTIHQQLRCDASRTAAREVLELVRGR